VVYFLEKKIKCTSLNSVKEKSHEKV